jgi:hypothetical protein
MIKLIAAITMLVDHFGIIFFPDVSIFRIIGRLSMPLFAYCIARGFYFSRQHGTVSRYCRNMAILSCVSQVPYYLMCGEGFNIGFTWLFSLLLLVLATTSRFKMAVKVLLISSVSAVLVALQLSGWFCVDYGIGGILTPLLFYLLISKKLESFINYVVAILCGWSVFVLSSGSVASMAQIVSVGSAAVLPLAKRYDRKVKLPKWFFYGFYPVHIMILLIIRYFVA